MKTIKQIAEENHVSKTAIRKYMSNSFRESYTETKNGVIYISQNGEKTIKSRLAKNAPQTENEDVSTNTAEVTESPANMVSALIETLQDELRIKNIQISAQNQQISELTATIRLQAESIKTGNQNILAETIIGGQALIDNPATPDNHRGKLGLRKWFARFAGVPNG